MIGVRLPSGLQGWADGLQPRYALLSGRLPSDLHSTSLLLHSILRSGILIGMLEENRLHTDSKNHTPLPDHLIEKRHSNVKMLVAFFFVFVVLAVVGVGGWYLYYFYTTPLIQVNSQNEDGITVLPSKNSVASPSASLEQDLDIPSDWGRDKSLVCNTTFRVPPAEEPYIIPRDPNTPPSSLEDEGKYWIFEDSDTQLFTLNHMARVIFKNPELPASGYVSSAVEVYCGVNDKDLTTESFFVQIQNDLLENYSVIKLKTVGGAELWGKEVRSATFEGGTFDADDIYYVFATSSNVYMIRTFGETANTDIQAVRDQILLGLTFE